MARRITFWVAGLVLAACVQAPVAQPVAMAEETPVAEYGFGVLADLAGTRWRGEPGEADKEHDQPADYSE